MNQLKYTFDEWYEYVSLIYSENNHLCSSPSEYINDYEAGLTPEEVFFAEHPEER